MKISEIITDKYKLRIPPTVYYDLLADVQEVEEEQEPTTKNNSSELEKNSKKLEKGTTKNDLGVKNLCELCGNAINCPMLAGVIREECGLYKPIDKNGLVCIDKWDLDGKKAELWIVKGKLQIRNRGTSHNIDLSSVTPQLSVPEVTALAEWKEKLTKASEDAYNKGYEAGIKAQEQEPQTFKWCTDCKEYDQEKHCCHRWSKVIRDTVEEMKQEQEPILDKIRAEIESLKRFEIRGEVTPLVNVDRVLEIIDKAESEAE